ncbi:MAG TPA: DUF4234 domain-containing protein [Patescibacteria group bacterium]|jgi:hypothetical protein
MAQDKAVKRSVLRTLGLTIITSGLYMFYWFYVTKNQLKQELKTDDNVGLQTVGLIVPILNAFIVYWLYRDINKARDSKKLETFPAGWYVGVPYILIAIAFAIGFGSFFSFIGSVVGNDTGGAVAATGGLVLALLFAFAGGISHYVFWGLAVSKLNQYWDKVGRTTAKFSTGEIVIVVLGLVLGYFNATMDRTANTTESDQQLEQLQQELDKYDTKY